MGTLNKYNNNGLLFVPAKDNTLAKVIGCGYPIIIDLEDSIPIVDKEIALTKVCSFIGQYKTSDSIIYVRINKDRMEQELVILSSYEIGYMIPKCEDAAFLTKYAGLLQNHAVIALIETPAGVLHAEEIANSPLVSAIAFGAEDFTACMNMVPSVDSLMPIKLKIVMSAKMYHKAVYDTPCFSLGNDDLLERDVESSVKLGFDGKLAIHPKQMDVIQKCFSNHDVTFYQNIINEYEKRGGGVQIIDGKIYESMHINRFKKIIKEHAI